MIGAVLICFDRRVTSAVSGKTTYLLRGRDAGESKLAKAKALKTTIVDEDGFYNMFEQSDGEKSGEDAPVEPVKKPATTKPKAPAKTSRPVVSGG